MVIGALLAPTTIGGTGFVTRLVVGVCIAANLFVYPGISGYLTLPAQPSFTPEGKRSLIERAVPVKTIVDDLNLRRVGGRVLFPQESPFGASLYGDPAYVNWYSTARQARFAAIHSEADVAAFLRDDHIDRVIWSMGETFEPTDPRAYLLAYLNHSAIPERKVGSFTSYLTAGPAPVYHTILDLKSLLAHPSEALGLQKVSTPAGLEVSSEPIEVARIETNAASAMRYSVRFRCRKPGSFVAQVNWDVAPAPYYRLVPCTDGFEAFEETLPIPAGALRGVVYATVRDTADGTVSDLTLSTN
jgi:hypothetical protein